VLVDARPGDLAEVHADVEPLGVGGAGEHVDAGAQQPMQIEELLVVELAQVAAVVPRDHHQVPVVVREAVEHHEGGAAGDHRAVQSSVGDDHRSCEFHRFLDGVGEH